jgi:hypothetical protein
MRECCFLRFFILQLLFGANLFAAELFEYNRPIRALGMGNVYLNFVRDTDAPTINPAALGLILFKKQRVAPKSISQRSKKDILYLCL